MKSREELKNIAAMLADNLVTVHCEYSIDAKTTYTFKATKEFAETLRRGMPVIAQSNKMEQPFSIVYVVKIDNECFLEENSSSKYCWLLHRVDESILGMLTKEEEDIVEKLYASQKRALKAKLLENLAITADDKASFEHMAIGVTVINNAL